MASQFTDEQMQLKNTYNISILRLAKIDQVEEGQLSNQLLLEKLTLTDKIMRISYQLGNDSSNSTCTTNNIVELRWMITQKESELESMLAAKKREQLLCERLENEMTNRLKKIDIIMGNYRLELASLNRAKEELRTAEHNMVDTKLNNQSNPKPHTTPYEKLLKTELEAKINELSTNIQKLSNNKIANENICQKLEQDMMLISCEDKSAEMTYRQRQIDIIIYERNLLESELRGCTEELTNRNNQIEQNQMQIIGVLEKLISSSEVDLRIKKQQVIQSLDCNTDLTNETRELIKNTLLDIAEIEKNIKEFQKQLIYFHNC